MKTAIAFLGVDNTDTKLAMTTRANIMVMMVMVLMVMRVMNMKMALLGVDNTERCDEVGDDHEGEEDEDEVVQVGSQQGEDEAPEMRKIGIIRENSFHSALSIWLYGSLASCESECDQPCEDMRSLHRPKPIPLGSQIGLKGTEGVPI